MLLKINICRILICSFLISSAKNSITGFDTPVVVDLKVLNENNPSQSCPYGYIASSGCDTQVGCDLNYGVGGNYIYLCQKKIKFKELSLNDKPISKILVTYNNRNCGNLKLIDSDLNSGAGGEYIYICYGTNEEDPSPITDFFIHIKGVNSVPYGYKCDKNDLNKGSSNQQVIEICFLKDKKIPKEIEYSNYIFDYSKKSILEIGEPNDIIFIDNDNSNGDSSQSIKRTVSSTIENSYSWNYNEEFSSGVSIKVRSNKLFIEDSFKFQAEFKENEYGQVTHIKSEKEEIDYLCEAPARRHIMCKGFNSKYKVSIPYKMDIIYHYFDGTYVTRVYQSEFTGILGTSIQFSKCCISRCTINDNICTQEEKNNYDFISGSCPEYYESEIDLEENGIPKEDPIVVSDLVILSDKNKNLNCPNGFEIVNAGCDQEGCDINKGAGGDYIYLCQKKQKLSSLTNQNPINTYKILYNNKDCGGSLAFIDKDLNKGAGGDYVYLCYGYDESLSKPIQDFFIFIEGINNPPIEYKCDITNKLSRGTKGYDIYLCYYRYGNSLAYKVEGGYSAPDNEVVTDLEVVSNDRKVISCPEGYQIVNAGCTQEGCDLNKGAGGDYIYLCQKKQQINKLSKNEKPINDFRILYNHKNAEKLKLINVDLNKGCGGDYIYLSYGNDPDKSLSPIIDFFIYIRDYNYPPEGYDCDTNDLNSRTGGYYIYLCYKRNDNIPKEIIVHNLNVNYEQSKKVSLGSVEKLDEIIVNSVSVTKTVETSVIEEKIIQNSISENYSIGVSFSILFLKEFGISTTFKYSLGEEWKEEITKTLSTKIECHAEPRKTMKCIPFYSKFEIDMPYTASLLYKNYKGEELGTQEFEGSFKKVGSSLISYKACCLEGCCTGNNQLDKDKPQCNNNTKDILCSQIEKCF